MAVHRGGRGPGHLCSVTGTPSGLGGGSANPALRVTMGTALLKLKDLNPLLRNDNITTSPMEIKIGPSALMLISSVPTMWFEAIQNTGYTANNGNTATMKATATTWQGPYTVSPSTIVVTPADYTTFEHRECSPCTFIDDAANSRLIGWFNCGNNMGPRLPGLGYSTDYKTGQSWTARTAPIPNGGSGVFDHAVLSDLKVIADPFGAGYICLYRAKLVDESSPCTIGRATGTTADNLTKTGQVSLTVPSWATTAGLAPSIPWIDAGGRWHMFPAGNSVGLGYFYSDDKGLTWTNGGPSGNQVLSAGAATEYDFAAGDTCQLIQDGDVLFIVYGGENIGGYTGSGGSTIRCNAAAITPAPKVTPTRVGKFHLASSRTVITASSLMNQTTYSIMGRFKAYRIDRSKSRRLYYEDVNPSAFNKSVFLALSDSGSGDPTPGTLHFFHRTPTGTPNGVSQMYSTATYDDAQWHTFLIRRTALGTWEMYVDSGTAVATLSSTSNLDATATGKCVGNTPTTVGVDQPSNCTISDFGIVTGAAWTWAEASAWITSRTLGSGGSVAFDLTANGTTGESGNVITVEAA